MQKLKTRQNLIFVFLNGLVTQKPKTRQNLIFDFSKITRQMERAENSGLNGPRMK